ncbi:SDR family NAD(P)-dependent oxidoreductase [Mycobacterium seoulense]|uniref:SDR family NAD(P)-dependent oxidoreductase n=1 Tax=Mycobacterium seoulense TaxID=386911 RepID=UPI003CEDDC91
MNNETSRVCPDDMLAGKVILITGASQGIGKVAVVGFARAGATVVLGARRGPVVKEVAEKITADGGRALALEVDVTSEDSVRSMVKATVDEFGRLDGAFNNAGIDQTPPGSLHDVDLQHWRDIHAVKVDGTFNCIKHEALAMMDTGGSIVNHGSVVSEHAVPLYPAAASSQSAMSGLTRVAAATYARNKIRVNLILTGAVLTPERADAAAAKSEQSVSYTEEAMRSVCPLGRFGQSEEVAAAAAWFLSDWSSYVTGASLPVDGGYLSGKG